MTREEAIKVLKETIDPNVDKSFKEWKEWDKEKHLPAVNMAIEALKAEPKHGEWGKGYRKTANGVDFLVLSCSECDNADPQMNYYNYCPNCGAKMDKD